MSYKERAQEIEQFELITEARGAYVIADDIDPYANHLHHTGPLKIFERERVRIFADHGMPVDEMAQSQGVFGFVRELVAKYSGQVLKGDNVEVVSRVFQTRPTILSFQQTMTREGQIMVEAVVDAALANRSGKPVRIPQEVVDNLKSNVD
ncbi:MAG: Acyl-CoA thioesterase (Tol-Pal associated) [Candidatus Curtissbacteria bacterium GW2011_GWA1_41_11]|uniref:Acyl-CoA thioesterase (Tol-Pal associated) n=1 Tax=Candidatus Curtissbacteria bacterium GW2011_GWA1_41_11 TaxID=1618409 RepID=A0A0G0XDT9_9BACT|nr:MAG: Acyl-CoA thioesterase (Tol-Pal associated) [Candidatus Curtissbacteria bacterium GW2011_GWA1_41_11]